MKSTWSVACAGALALGVCAFAGGAIAADLGGPRHSMKDGAAPYIAAEWTGLYIGLQSGYVWGSARHSFSNGAPTDNSDPDGYIYGGHIGYNLQSGAFVYGIEADFEGGDASGRFQNLTGGTSAGSVDMNWQGSLRARLGVVHGSMMFYATGGWAFGDFDFGGGPAGPICCGYSETLNGWTIGAGAEWKLTSNITARLEYRYTDFGSASSGLAPAFPGVVMPVELDTHAIRSGITLKF